MAQTKTKAKSRPKTQAKAKRKKPGSGSKQRSNSTKRTQRPRSSSAKPAPVAAVGKAADKATDTVGSAARKAKVPLVAGGAAIVGAAGGMALGARQARRHNGHDLKRAAKNVGTFGAQVGRLASEIHQARESSSNGKHRSPVEVVLEGLTARRSRA